MYHHIIEQNAFLNRDVNGFYYCDYTNMRERGESYFINELKNDYNYSTPTCLNNAINKLSNILLADLPRVLTAMEWPTATVCVVPRSKTADFYQPNQLLFARVVGAVTEQLANLKNGATFIRRHTHTRTTHRGDQDTIGSKPYVGITQQTCFIADEVAGQNIILVDDIYTRSINVDEDMIQALFDKGAKSVCLYTVAKTVKKYY